MNVDSLPTATLLKARGQIQRSLDRRPDRGCPVYGTRAGRATGLPLKEDWWWVRSGVLTAIQYELWRRRYPGVANPLAA